MTVCAWDGTYLAADRQATVGNVRSAATKIRKCGRFWYAMAGATWECHHVARWLAAGADPDEAPIFSDDDNSYGMAVRAGRVYAIEGRAPVLIELDVGKHAVGSGRDFALVAMSMGKSAKEAVEIACQFDVYSGMGVQVVKVGRAKR